MTKRKEIQLRLAKLKLDLSQSTLDRLRRLAGTPGAVSEAEIETATYFVEVAKCEVELAALPDEP